VSVEVRPGRPRRFAQSRQKTPHNRHTRLDVIHRSDAMHIAATWRYSPRRSGTVSQVAGRSTMTQNDQTLQLAGGDVVLEDAARPVTYFTNNRSMKWLGLQMPRQPPTLKSRRSITKQGHRHGYLTTAGHGHCRRRGSPPCHRYAGAGLWRRSGSALDV